jgi:hypothetical protein
VKKYRSGPGSRIEQSLRFAAKTANLKS